MSKPNSVKILAAEVLDRNVRIARLENLLRMVLQLTDSGGHDGGSVNCPTCHVANEIRKVLR